MKKSLYYQGLTALIAHQRLEHEINSLEGYRLQLILPQNPPINIRNIDSLENVLNKIY